MFISAVDAYSKAPAIQMGIGGIPDSQLDAAKKLVFLRLKELYPDCDYTLDQIDVDDFSWAEWSDASLGFPLDGEFYGQVITPGYVIHLSVDGHTFTVHTNADSHSLGAILP